MTSISTTITNGITLGAGYYGNSVTVLAGGAIAPATPGATAVYGAAPGVYLLNQGTIEGGAGAYQIGTGMTGGDGVLLADGGTVVNAGLIAGGAGGAGTTYGGAGGIGVDLAAGGMLTNAPGHAVVTGGAGGTGATGGVGGVGVALGASATLADGGRVYGGAGGTGTQRGGNGGDGAIVAAGAVARSGYYAGGGHGGSGQTGGNGGTGIYVATAGYLMNTSLVRGGHGGAGILVSGAGGAGVVLGAGAALVNDAIIAGGYGGYGLGYPFAPGGAGGAGVAVGSGATVTNAGLITGGYGGHGIGTTVAGGAGGVGAYVNGGTLTTSGTIAGGLADAGTGARADAVLFGSTAGTLVVEAGASFTGAVVADAAANDVLVLGGSTGFTLAGIGTQITGFSAFSFGPAGGFTLEGSAAGLAQGQLISGFAPGDTIDMDGVAASGLGFSAGGTLSLATGSGAVNLLFGSGNSFAADHFALSADGHGGTDVMLLAGNVASTLALLNPAAINDAQTDHPFAGAQITDPNGGPPSDSLVITLSGGDANGTLSGAGLTRTGAGTYTLAAASPATLDAELQALVFTPTAHEVAAGQTVVTQFALTDTNAAGLIGMASTSLTVTALNYINGPAGGFGLLVGTAGEDVITAHGYGNLIFGGGGPDIINAGAGLAYVNVASGSATVTLGGALNLVQGGNGNVTVTGAAGGFTGVQLGNGNNTVSIGGTGDVIQLGNGSNIVSGTQGFAFIATGSGNDTITLGGIGNTVNAGGGTNTIIGGLGHDTFVLPGAGQGLDLISGFLLTNGDMLNVDAALRQAGWNGNAATLGNYLKVTDSGNVATIAIAPGGSGAGIAVAELMGAGNITLAGLLASHALR